MTLHIDLCIYEGSITTYSNAVSSSKTDQFVKANAAAQSIHDQYPMVHELFHEK